MRKEEKRMKKFKNKESMEVASMPNKNTKIKEIIDNEYIYMDENGNIICKKVFKKCKKRNYEYRMSFNNENGEWKKGAKDVGSQLYNAPFVTAEINNTNKIYWVQNEKSADRLKTLGIIATTVIGGSKGIITDEILEKLKGVDVVIIPNNNSRGKAYAKRIARTLYKTAKTIKILDLMKAFPNLYEADDIGEIIKKMRNDSLVKRRLKKLEQNTKCFYYKK